jgi:surface antigen
MKKLITFVLSVLLGVSLAACADSGMGTKEGFGTLLGAAGGAVIGSQFGSGDGQLVGVAIGTLAGAMIGNEIGKSLDKADRMYASRALERAQSAPVGETITWENPKSGNRGSVTTVREGRSSSGAYCREFQQTVVIGGHEERAYGTACQQPDGSWKIVQS